MKFVGKTGRSKGTQFISLGWISRIVDGKAEKVVKKNARYVENIVIIQNEL